MGDTLRLVVRKSMSFLHSTYAPQISYFGLMCGMFVIFVYEFYPFTGADNLFPEYHRYTTLLSSAANLFLYVKVCESNPGRSKAKSARYCRHCEAHVAGHDHHCVWIHNCVGERNWLLFVFFLFSHILMCLYGFVLTTKLLLHDAKWRGKDYGIFVIDGVTRPWSWLGAALYYQKYEPFLALLNCTCATMAIVLSGLMLFQLFVHFAAHSTTSELLKPRRKRAEEKGS